MLTSTLPICSHLHQASTALAVVKEIQGTEFRRFTPKHRPSPNRNCPQSHITATMFLHKFLESNVIMPGRAANIDCMTESFEEIPYTNHVSQFFGRKLCDYQLAIRKSPAQHLPGENLRSGKSCICPQNLASHRIHSCSALQVQVQTFGIKQTSCFGLYH